MNADQTEVKKMEREGVFGNSVSYVRNLVGNGEAILAFGRRLLPGLTDLEDVPGVTDTRRERTWW